MTSEMCPGCNNEEEHEQVFCEVCRTEMCEECVGPEGRCKHHPVEDAGATCECCNTTYDDERIAGCCRDGDCPHNIETLCHKCGTWDEEEGVWQCPACAEDESESESESEDDE